MSGTGAEIPIPPRRRRRWLRWLLLGFTLLVCLVLAAPHAVALDPVRRKVERELAAATGAPCRIGRMGFSWFSGFAARDVVIGNPAGFPTERPALRFSRAAIDFGIDSLLRGDLRIEGSLQGLELFVEQQADGTTNLQALGRRHHVTPGEPEPSPQPPAPRGDGNWLHDLHCDLQVQDSSMEVRRDGALLEALTGITCRVQKHTGSEQLRIEFDSKLQPTTAAGDTGRLGLQLDVDLRQQGVEAMLSAAGLDLRRYGPLVDTFLPGRLTALAGITNGTLRLVKLGDGLQLDGDLAISEPHLAGPLLHGMELRGSHWTLQPALKLAGDAADTRRFRVDLGWLELRGTEAPAGAAARFAWQLDVDALAGFGGPMPAMLRGTGARATGTIDLQGMTLPTTAAAWSAALRAAAEFTLPKLDVAGFAVRDLAADATFDGQAVQLRTRETTRLDAGPLQLVLDCQLGDLTSLPTTLSVRWRDGQLQGGAIGALRYLVPLLAGLDGEASGLRGNCDFEVALAGPGRPAADQNWLQWLDRWTGEGRIALRSASFQPARGLSALVAPLGALAGPGNRLGDGTSLAIDGFEAPFRFAQSAIVTTAGKWLAKGRAIGLSGTVRLDGALDYGLDLTALLRGHRDGDRVLQALDGQLPAARLQGTVQAPALGLPDFATVLGKVAERELQQRGSELIRKELEDLLRRSKRR